MATYRQKLNERERIACEAVSAWGVLKNGIAHALEGTAGDGRAETFCVRFLAAGKWRMQHNTPKRICRECRRIVGLRQGRTRRASLVRLVELIQLSFLPEGENDA